MELGEKLEILLSNREWTQKQFADKLFLTESAVQKWIVGKAYPRYQDLKDICDLLEITYEELMNPDIKMPMYLMIDQYELWEQLRRPEQFRDSEHRIYDAELGVPYTLHRFKNPAGVDYSAIYFGRRELYSCERESEFRMIKWFREGKELENKR